MINTVIHLKFRFLYQHYIESRSKNYRIAHPEGLEAFEKITAEVYNYTHTDTKDKPRYSCPNKGYLMVPTVPQCGSHIPTNGLSKY